VTNVEIAHLNPKDGDLTLHYLLPIPLLLFVLLVRSLGSTIHIKLVTNVEIAHLNPKDDDLTPTP
jgi:hypothetical protein